MRGPRSIRTRILANSGLVLLLLAAASLYSGIGAWDQDRNVEALFRTNLDLEALKTTLLRTQDRFSEYLRSKGSDALKDYIKVSTVLADQARVWERTPADDDLRLLQRDLGRTLGSFLEATEAGVQAKRGRDIAGYAERSEAAGRHLEAALTLISVLEARSLARSFEAFSQYRKLLPWVLGSNLVLIAAAALLALALVIVTSRTLAAPLVRLAEAAAAVDRGRYDLEIPPARGRDETAVLTEAFTKMLASVRRSFTDIQARAEAEKRLLEEKMRVLDLDHKLKDAELLALQTQINPHFLFNTLAAGMELAATEEAARTEDFLQNLAHFIRYALTPPDRFVLVADEVEAAKRYIWLLRLRFRDRFAFDLRVDEAVLGVEVPALVIQPLVENAVSHGLADRERGGRVEVTAGVEGPWAVLTVKDNGVGMAEADRRALGAEALEAAAQAPGIHGIGLRNVVRRISLSTGGRGRVDLGEAPGGGLEVRVLLPLDPEGGRS